MSVCLAAVIPALVAVQGCATVPGPTDVAPAAKPADVELVRIRAAVHDALQCGRGCAPFLLNVRLLSVERVGDTIVLDFSKELVAAGTGGAFEDELHRLLAAASSSRTPPLPRREDYRVLVDGVPLDKIAR